jgi:hypothetical protein
VAAYLAENDGIAVRISPRDWVACVGKPAECLFGADFVAGSSESLQRALVGTFCRPASDRGCDREALGRTIGRMHYLTGDATFRVYRLDPRWSDGRPSVAAAAPPPPAGGSVPIWLLRMMAVRRITKSWTKSEKPIAA